MIWPDGFFYVKLYPDGTFIDLATNLDSAEFYLRKFYSCEYSLSDMQHNYLPNGINLWEMNKSNQIWADCREIFNIGNGFSLSAPSDLGHTEMFFFYSSATNYRVNELYLNQLGIFKSFILYFKEKTAKLVKKAENCKITMPRAFLEKEARKKWLRVLENDEKQRTVFKEQLQERIKGYLSSKNDEVEIENLIMEIINLLKTKHGSNLSEQNIVGFLKPLLKEAFRIEKRCLIANNEKRNAFILCVCQEVQLSIDEKEINASHKADIFRARIKAGILLGLHQTDQLLADEKIFYDQARKILARLRQLRNRKEESQRKTNIELGLIFEALLLHPAAERILSVSNQDLVNEAKMPLNQDIAEYVARKKFAFENSKDKRFKDRSYYGLSVDANNQQVYKTNIQKAVTDWVAHHNPRRYSISRNTVSTSVYSLDYDNESQSVVFSANQIILLTHFVESLNYFIVCTQP